MGGRGRGKQGREREIPLRFSSFNVMWWCLKHIHRRSPNPHRVSKWYIESGSRNKGPTACCAMAHGFVYNRWECRIYPVIFSYLLGGKASTELPSTDRQGTPTSQPTERHKRSSRNIVQLGDRRRRISNGNSSSSRKLSVVPSNRGQRTTSASCGLRIEERHIMRIRPRRGTYHPTLFRW